MSRKSSQVEKPDHVTVCTGDAFLLLFLDHIPMFLKAAEIGAALADSFLLNAGEHLCLF